MHAWASSSQPTTSQTDVSQPRTEEKSSTSSRRHRTQIRQDMLGIPTIIVSVSCDGSEGNQNGSWSSQPLCRNGPGRSDGYVDGRRNAAVVVVAVDADKRITLWVMQKAGQPAEKTPVTLSAFARARSFSRRLYAAEEANSSIFLPAKDVNILCEMSKHGVNQFLLCRIRHANYFYGLS